MNRGASLAAVLAMTCATTVAVACDPAWVWPLAAVALAMDARRPGRVSATLGFPAAFYGAVLAVVAIAAAAPWGEVPAAAARGATAGLRLGIALAANVAILQRHPAEAILDGLRLSRRTTAWLGAVVLASHDVARDASHLLAARRLEGHGRITAAAGVVAGLVERSLARARIRADALRLAGVTPPGAFVPIVAVAALVTMDRLALVAVPNLKLSFAAAFCGGLLFGAGRGMAAAALGMALSDFALSGLYVVAFANVPAMALVALAGAAVRPLRRHLARRPARWVLAGFGAVATLAFSVAADLATAWLSRLTEGGQSQPALAVVVASGLAFNAVPALVNAAVFAAAVPAVLQASAPAPGRTAPSS